MEARIEAGYDEATSLYDARVAAREVQRRLSSSKDSCDDTTSSAYQFVGVVNKNKQSTTNSNNDVTWYARKKPKSSKWNVRLIHVNQDAVLRDLFVKGKIDLFAGYKNEGMGVVGGSVEDGEESNNGRPKILGEYTVKERSWR